MSKLLTFYIEGFKSMTIGRKLWLLIIVKLIIIFAIIKVMFFSETTDSRAADRQMTPAEYIRSELTQ